MLKVATHILATMAGIVIGWIAFLDRPVATATHLAIPVAGQSKTLEPPKMAISSPERPINRELQTRLDSTLTELSETRQSLQVAEVRAAAAESLAYSLLERIASASRDPTHPLKGLLESDAVRLGELTSRINIFREKYASGPPAQGTPEGDAYAAEQKSLTADISANVANPELRDIFESRDSAAIARTKLLMLDGQLSLQTSQSAQIYNSLLASYTEAFNHSLDLAATHQPNDTTWLEQRSSIAVKTANTVRTVLTPDQQLIFDKSSPTEFMWSILPDLLQKP